MTHRRGRATSLFRVWVHRQLWPVLCGLSLLLALPLAVGQDFRTIGGNLTKAQIEELRQQIAAGQLAQERLKESEPIKLDVGTFFPFRFGQANQLWLWDDETICSRVDVPAGQKFALWGMVVGDPNKTASLHQYDAKQEPWGFLIGVKEGTTRITVISNGEGGGPPVVLDRITITVGVPKPPPPPPDDALTKSLRDALAKDTVQGKGDKRVLKDLADLYRLASGDDLSGFATVGQLDASLLKSSETMKLPPPALQLTAVRYLVKDLLQKAIGVTDTDFDKPFTPDTRRLAREAMAKIAAALEVLSR